MERPIVNYDQLSSVYDARYAVGPLVGITTALADLVRAHPDARILEVGCGTGHWLRELRPHTPLLFGADLSPGMLSHAARKSGSIPLLVAAANALPFAESSFGLIYTVNAIHHFADPAAFIADAARLLEPGGVLAILGIDPRLNRQRYFYDYFEGTYELDLHRYPSIGDMVHWMAVSGFERVEYRIIERYEKVFRGRAVLEDHFLKKDSNSLLALMSEAEYRRGISAIEDAANRSGAEFLYKLDFIEIAGTLPKSRG